MVEEMLMEGLCSGPGTGDTLGKGFWVYLEPRGPASEAEPTEVLHECFLTE